MLLRPLTVLSFAVALASSAPSFAADAAPEFAKPNFAAPVRVKAGERFLGLERMYPSPVFQDMNGDQLLDVVIGDLPGNLTVAHRKAGAGPASFEAEQPLTGADKKPLKFHNW